jgi:hypothetical protein
MITYGKRQFVIEVSINYTHRTYQIKKTKDLLEDMITRKNLDLSYELELLVDDRKLTSA